MPTPHTKVKGPCTPPACTRLVWKIFKRDKTQEIRASLPKAIENRSVLISFQEDCTLGPSLRNQLDLVIYYNHNDNSNVMHLPIGPNHGLPFIPTKEVALHPSSKRRYLFNMVVSLSTQHIARGKWQQRALRWREELMGSRPNSTDLRNVNTCTYIASSPKWSKPDTYKGAELAETITYDCPAAGAGGTNGITVSHVPPSTWREVLLNSSFTLSPAGKNNECFRMWEAAEAGSIPVLVRNEHSMLGKDPEKTGCALHPDVMQQAPFLFVDRGGDMFEAMAELARNPKALDARSREVRAWYAVYMRHTIKKAEEVLITRAQGPKLNLAQLAT
jgi:hypothetical protein